MDLPIELWAIIGNTCGPKTRLTLSTTCRNLSFLTRISSAYLRDFTFRKRIYDGVLRTYIAVASTETMNHGETICKLKDFEHGTFRFEASIFRFGQMLLKYKWNARDLFITDLNYKTSKLRQCTERLIYETILRGEIMINAWPHQQEDMYRFDGTCHMLSDWTGIFVLRSKRQELEEHPGYKPKMLVPDHIPFYNNRKGHIEYIGKQINRLILPYVGCRIHWLLLDEDDKTNDVNSVITKMEGELWHLDKRLSRLALDEMTFYISSRYLEISYYHDEIGTPVIYYVSRITDDFQIIFDTAAERETYES